MFKLIIMNKELKLQLCSKIHKEYFEQRQEYEHSKNRELLNKLLKSNNLYSCPLDHFITALHLHNIDEMANQCLFINNLNP